MTLVFKSPDSDMTTGKEYFDTARDINKIVITDEIWLTITTLPKFFFKALKVNSFLKAVS